MTSYKILGQNAPSADTETNFYTTPSGSATVVRAIDVTNTSSTADTFDIAIVEYGAVVQERESLVFSKYNTLYFSKDGTYWTPSTVNSVNFNINSEVKYLGQSLAANTSNTILKSDNFYDWSTSKTAITGSSINSAAVSDNEVVFVGKYGTFYRSTDLTNWQGSSSISGSFSPFADNEHPDITYGSGVFVTIGRYTDYAAISTDGISWTQSTMPQNAGWWPVQYGNGTFVAAAYGYYAATSTDGITWTAQTMSGNRQWKSIAHGNNVFVAVAPWGQEISRSTDGVTWTASTMPNWSGWLDIEYGNGIFVAIGNNGSANIAYSTDGITWTSVADGDNFQSITYGSSTFFVTPYYGQIIKYSTDSVTWSSTTLPFVARWAAISKVPSGFVTYDYYNDGQIAYSTDGITWTDTGFKMGNVNCNEFATNDTNSLSVIPVRAGFAFTSTDGITWLYPFADNYNIYNAENSWVEYGVDKFVSVGTANAGSSNATSYSTDGLTWVQGSLPVSAKWNSLMYGGGKFIAFSYNTTDVVYSTDGASWSQSSLTSSSYWGNAAYANGKYIVTSSQISRIANVSTDAITWTAATLPLGSGGYYGITALDNKFFLMDGLAVYSSTDAVTWTTLSNDSFGASSYSLSSTKIYAGEITSVSDLIFSSSEIVGNETIVVKGGYTMGSDDQIRIKSTNGTSTFHAFGGEI